MTNQRFDGVDIIPERDEKRLTLQYLDIFNLMKDGQHRTLKQIHALTSHPESSISAQLRNLRKPRFGSHTINRQYLGNGLYSYQLIENKGK